MAQNKRPRKSIPNYLWDCVFENKMKLRDFAFLLKDRFFLKLAYIILSPIITFFIVVTLIYAKFILIPGIIYLIYKLFFKNKSQTKSVNSENNLKYIFPFEDSYGNHFANWLFRDKNASNQFSLKCAYCSDILYTTNSSGRIKCKNDHLNFFQISENLFTKNFEMIDENTDYVKQVYLESMFELLGTLSKSDGKISEEEIDYSLYLMNKYIDTENNREYVEALQNAFRRGRDRNNLIEATNLLKFILKNDQNARIKIITVMIEISNADGIIGETEKTIIRNVSKIFGDIPENILNEKLGQFKKQYNYQSRNTENNLENCFRTLESQKTDSRDTVKRNYFRLSKKYHPDQFIGNDKSLKLAEEKMKQINLAWDTVKDYFDNKN